MSEEIVNENNAVEDEMDVNDIDIGVDDSDDSDGNLDENQSEEEESDTQPEDDESNESDETDEGNAVKLTQEEYNQLMMNKRLLEKMSKQEEQKPAPKNEEATPFSKLKEKYPDMDEESLNTLVDVVSEIAGTQFKDVVEQTTEQRLKSEINEYAQANGLDAEATKLLSTVAVKPEVKKLLVDNIIDIEQLEILAYGKQWKEEAAKLRVSQENSGRKKNVHSETKSSGQSKKASSNKSIDDMSWDEFAEYEKRLGIEYR